MLPTAKRSENLPQARVSRNTERILDAAVEVAAAEGWASLSLGRVGRAAGLSIRPVIVRFGDRSTLASAVWRERTGPALETALAQALDGAGLLDGGGDPEAFSAAMETLARSGPDLDATVELLIASPHDPALRAAVAETTGERVVDWLHRPRNADGRARAARRAYVVALGLGLIATSRRRSIGDLRFQTEWTKLTSTLRVDHAPTRLPARPRPPHLDEIHFDTGDATLDDLLEATIEHVASKGYEAATLAEIARTARVSPATTLLRHGTKQDLFIDAAARLQAIAMRGHHAVHEQIATEHGDAIATASRIRAVMHPDEAASVAVDLERVRLTWHDPVLAEREEDNLRAFAAEMRTTGTDPATFATDEDVHLAYALGIGVELLPILAPDAWDLPYDVVTVPLAER